MTAYFIVYALFREGVYVVVYEFNFWLKFEWACTKLQIIETVRKHILTGGPKRLPFTVPPLMFSSLKVWLTILISPMLLFYTVLHSLLLNGELIMLAAMTYDGDHTSFAFWPSFYLAVDCNISLTLQDDNLMGL